MSIDAPIATADNWFIGEDRTLEFTVVDSAGTAQNITGWALEWVLRDAPGNATALLTKTVGDGITITDGAAGRCDVAIADTDTESLSPNLLFHTLRRTDDGLETVLAFGEALLKQAATR